MLSRDARIRWRRGAACRISSRQTSPSNAQTSVITLRRTPAGTEIGSTKNVGSNEATMTSPIGRAEVFDVRRVPAEVAVVDPRRAIDVG